MSSDSAPRVRLPGGLVREGERLREAVFHPLTGKLEQWLLEDTDGLYSHPPRFVTRTLTKAVAAIDGRPVNEDIVRSLCVADRQFLMIQLAARVDGPAVWLSFECVACGEPFDVHLDRTAVPVKPATADYPERWVAAGGRQIKVRTITGGDQEAIIGMDDTAAAAFLLQACITAAEDGAPVATLLSEFTPDDTATVEAAVEEMTPALATQMSVVCPECGKRQTARIDPYRIAGLNEHLFYQEIHTVAFHYHWSETEILSLPRDRRRRYLKLIDRERGLYT